VITTDLSGPDLGLATGDPDVRTFNLGSPFLSLSLSTIFNFDLLKYFCSSINSYMILLFNILFWM
jgi:hypothetical protein